MHLPWGRIAVGGATVALAFAGAIWTVNPLWPAAGERRPASADGPPLRDLTRTSMIVTSVAIALPAIRDKMEKVVPGSITEKRDNPPVQSPASAGMGWTITRGPLALSGQQPGAIVVSTAFNGTIRTTGQAVSQDRHVNDLLRGTLKQGAQNPAEITLDLNADFRGNVNVTSQPELLPDWRIEPNLVAQIAVSEASLAILGGNVNISNEVKPLLDRVVGEEIARLQTQVRDERLVESAAQRAWAEMCRSISLGAVRAGMPNLWLEARPTRAFAGQPRIDETTLTLTIGVQAETRIVPSETKPECPFPAQVELVPQVEQGRVNVAMPIDIPFSELNRLLEAQLKGKTFPEGKGNAVAATVRSVRVAPAGDRLRVSLGVRAKERKWFGLSAAATIHATGRPVLDPRRQTLRIDGIALDIQPEADSGLLGAVARFAVPFLEKALAEKAVIDLKPLAADARKRVAEALADFQKSPDFRQQSADGIRVDAAVTSMRLVGIAFSATTLRVVGEADGTVRVAVTKLP